MMVAGWVRVPAMLQTKRHSETDTEKIMETNYLGLAGIVSHSKTNVDKYNRLLSLLGSDGMTIQFERFLNDELLTAFISHIEDNLVENNIKIPY